MTLLRVDHKTVLNLDAVATIKFSDGANGRSATVNFLTPAPGSGTLVSETFSGAAAQHLDRAFQNTQVDDLREVEAESGEATPKFSVDFVRTKAWYFAKGPARGYFIAFINAKGSCSMRTFDADSGRFLSKKYLAGNYQEQFAEVIHNAVELTVESQPNLERDCKIHLPDSVLSQLKKQVK